MGNILAVSCSPREISNSHILLEHFIKGSRAAGARCRIYRLRGLEFRACTGCEACSLTGECVFGDDLAALFEAFRQEADALVLAAPVYAMGINALGKAMIDRSQVFWARKFILKQPPLEKKPAFFLSTAGRENRETFFCAQQTARYFFKMLDLKGEGELLVNPVDGPGEIMQLPIRLLAAREAGYLFARSINGRPNT